MVSVPVLTLPLGLNNVALGVHPTVFERRCDGEGCIRNVGMGRADTLAARSEVKVARIA